MGHIPSSYDTVRHGSHGKIHHAIKFGKPSISIRAMADPHGELLVIQPG